MSVYISRFKVIIIAGTVSTASLTAAHAFDARDIANRAYEVLGRQQITLSYDEPRMEGDDVILPNAAFIQKTGAMQKLGDLVLEDVTEDADGNYRIGRFAKDYLRLDNERTALTINGYEEKGIILVRDAEADPYRGVLRAESTNIDSIEIIADDAKLAEMHNIRSSTAIAADSTAETHLGMGRYVLYNLKDAKGDDQSFLKAMGHDELTGNLDLSYTVAPSTGHLTFQNTRIVVDNLGTFDLKGSISGATPGFADQFATLATQDVNTEAQQTMMSMAMFGLVQQLSLHDLTIRFDDNGLTDEVLDHLAKEQGSTREQVVEEAKEKVGPMLQGIFGPSAEGKMTTFLNEPRNLEISATPSVPVSFFLLTASAMSSPETLAKELNLKLTTNQ